MVPRLVLLPEQVHSQKAPHAAAQSRNEQQGGLPDAPAVFPGLPLVHKHKKESKRIDYKQIERKQLHVNFLSGGIRVKTILIGLMLALLLSGCGAEETL